jgi:hypothetical protein
MNDMVHRESVSILLEEKHKWVKTLSMEAIKRGIWGEIGGSVGRTVQGRGEIPANAIEKICRMIRTRHSNLRAV